jgi:hypothetical protein
MMENTRENKYFLRRLLKPVSNHLSRTTNFSLQKGYKELLNPVYGMGRWSASYRGHLLVYHGATCPVPFSNILHAQDSVGVIVFVIGDQSAPLYNIISYNVYERLLGLDLTPWSERVLADVVAGKKAGREGRSKASIGRVQGTKPSHPLEDYVGQFENSGMGLSTSR